MTTEIKDVCRNEAEQEAVGKPPSETATASKRKFWLKLAAVLLAALAALALCAFAMLLPDDGAQDETKAVRVDAESKAVPYSTVEVELEAPEAGDATKALILVSGNGREIRAQVKPNERKAVGSLPPGSYELNIVAAPVAEDGGTYEIPEPVGIDVGSEGRTVSVKMALVKIAVEGMSPEQAEAAAAALESEGKPDAAASVRSLAPSPAHEDGGRNEPADSPGGNTQQGGAQAPDSAGSQNAEGSAPRPPDPEPAPEPEPPAHVHYFEPIYGDVCWCGTPNPSPDHMKNHRLAGECGPGGLNNVQNNVITGYRPCSCGATA